MTSDHACNNVITNDANTPKYLSYYFSFSRQGNRCGNVDSIINIPSDWHVECLLKLRSDHPCPWSFFVYITPSTVPMMNAWTWLYKWRFKSYFEKRFTRGNFLKIVPLYINEWAVFGGWLSDCILNVSPIKVYTIYFLSQTLHVKRKINKLWTDEQPLVMVSYPMLFVYWLMNWLCVISTDISATMLFLVFHQSWDC